jgi:hypothetical protein
LVRDGGATAGLRKRGGEKSAKDRQKGDERARQGVAQGRKEGVTYLHINPQICDWETRRLREAAKDVRRSLKRHALERPEPPPIGVRQGRDYLTRTL